MRLRGTNQYLFPFFVAAKRIWNPTWTNFYRRTIAPNIHKSQHLYSQFAIFTWLLFLPTLDFVFQILYLHRNCVRECTWSFRKSHRCIRNFWRNTPDALSQNFRISLQTPGTPVKKRPDACHSGSIVPDQLTPVQISRNWHTESAAAARSSQKLVEADYRLMLCWLHHNSHLLQLPLAGWLALEPERAPSSPYFFPCICVCPFPFPFHHHHQQCHVATSRPYVSASCDWRINTQNPTPVSHFPFSPCHHPPSRRYQMSPILSPTRTHVARQANRSFRHRHGPVWHREPKPSARVPFFYIATLNIATLQHYRRRTFDPRYIVKGSGLAISRVVRWCPFRWAESALLLSCVTRVLLGRCFIHAFIHKFVVGSRIQTRELEYKCRKRIYAGQRCELGANPYYWCNIE